MENTPAVLPGQSPYSDAAGQPPSGESGGAGGGLPSLPGLGAPSGGGLSGKK